ncbi:MAG: F0F1 ATP synthase subunit delta [Acidobacteriaceae bacterium]
MAVYSSRYARAFAQIVTAVKLDATAAQQQLADFAATVDSNRELRELLMNPSIAQEQKVRILDAISQRLGMFPQVRNFIAVILEHQRLGDLNEILSEYAAVADEQSGLVEAEIISAHPLDEDDRRQLESQVAKKAGGQVRTTYSQDPSLLGGVVVKIGSTVYDGSVKAQLVDLRQRLAGAQVA